MIIGPLLLVIIIGILVIYMVYFKEYNEVMKKYKTLIKVLETRDLLLMRIISEVKDKKVKEETIRLIKQRIDCKKGGCNDLVVCDVALNKQLPATYREIDKIKNNMVIEEFKKIVSLEKKLKIIRREYNKAVDKYNENLIRHKKMCIKYLRMKPLDNYSIK